MIVRRKAKELYNLNDEDTAELVKMIKERYMGPEYDLDELAKEYTSICLC